MPKKIKNSLVEVGKKRPRINLVPKISTIYNVNQFLGIIFHIVWIFVGLFLVFAIILSFRQGLLNTFLEPSTRPQSQMQPQTQVPTETTIPGIGKVNIACVQNALKLESIQKIVEEGNTSSLTTEEKAKFEPCIVGEEEKKSP